MEHSKINLRLQAVTITIAQREKNPKDLKEDMASLQLSIKNWKFIPTHGVHFAHVYIGTYHMRTACWLRRLTKYEETLASRQVSFINIGNV